MLLLSVPEIARPAVHTRSTADWGTWMASGHPPTMHCKLAGSGASRKDFCSGQTTRGQKQLHSEKTAYTAPDLDSPALRTTTASSVRKVRRSMMFRTGSH